MARKVHVSQGDCQEVVKKGKKRRGTSCGHDSADAETPQEGKGHNDKDTGTVWVCGQLPQTSAEGNAGTEMRRTMKDARRSPFKRAGGEGGGEGGKRAKDTERRRGEGRRKSESERETQPTRGRVLLSLLLVRVYRCVFSAGSPFLRGDGEVEG